MSYNLISSFLAQAFGDAAFEELYLSYNSLETIDPDAFEGLTVSALDLRYNQITELTPFLNIVWGASAILEIHHNCYTLTDDPEGDATAYANYTTIVALEEAGVTVYYDEDGPEGSCS